MSDAGKEGGYLPSSPALSSPFLVLGTTGSSLSPPQPPTPAPARVTWHNLPTTKRGLMCQHFCFGPIMKTPLMCDSQETTPPVRAVAAAAAKSLQSCPTLCNPIDGSPPGSPSLGFSRQEHWSGLPLPSPPQLQKGWQTAEEQGGYKQSCSSPRLVLLLETRRRIFLAWHTHSPC